MSKLYRDCKHGQLARQCPHCENETMESEIEALRAQVAALEARLREAGEQKPVAYEISHDSPADIPHYKGADVFTADKIAAYESHGFIVRPLTYTAPVPAQPVAILAPTIEQTNKNLEAAGSLLRVKPAVPKAVAKDAARYRFIRDENTNVGNIIDKRDGIHTGVHGEFMGYRYSYRCGADLDARIDAAMLSAADTEVKK